jgi:hypothetical protein
MGDGNVSKAAAPLTIRSTPFYLSRPMIHTVTVDLPPGDVLARAKTFFAERVPHASAFPEQEGPQFVLLRGQGGEELVISARLVDGDQGGGTSRVRASTLFFDQALDRFFCTLPLASEVEIA